MTALLRRIRGEVEDALLAWDDMSSLCESGSDCARERLENLWSSLPFGVALMSARGKLLAMNLEMAEGLGQRGRFLPLCNGDFASALGRRSRDRLHDAIDQVIAWGGEEDPRWAAFSVGGMDFRLGRVDGFTGRALGHPPTFMILTANEARSGSSLRD
ncbi:hypothetical protein [Fulvimarina sp. MAC3]|uniref:hypothetical protein n=1 Tax=Fulvimarina sp. MAC3 TaxID=3148887 RepID=UPI0031FCFD59